jgi:predicted DNA-binding helix-hairpin-helix protein
MEALKRKPDLSVRKTMKLGDGTTIDVKGVTARRMMEIVNNKRYTDVERGMHITAEKILVNGSPIVYDDLLDSFTEREVTQIVQFASEEEEDGGSKNE